MRDAESMLDQLLGAAGRIDEAQVRSLLGLAESEAVDRLLAALVDGDPATGIAVLDELDDRGRDIAVVLDQVIDALRSALATGLTSAANPARQARLAAVARRLAAIDPERRGVGGMRLQVELALFAAATGPSDPRVAAARPAAAPPAVAGQPAAARPTPAIAQPVIATQPAAAAQPAADHGLVAEPPEAEPEPTKSPTPRSRAATRTKPEAAAAEPIESEVAHTTEPAPMSQPAPAPGHVDSATSQPAATPSTAPDAPPSEGLEQLRRLWPDIVAHLSLHPPTKPLIAACRPISVEGNVVTLGFPEGQAFLRDVAERRRTNLEEGIGQFLGRIVAVRCVATNLEVAAPLPGDTDAAYVLAEARRIFGEDLVDVGEVS
jgi:DNA polymerase III gamma/tau subunit